MPDDEKIAAGGKERSANAGKEVGEKAGNYFVQCISMPYKFFNTYHFRHNCV
jgi:hypothetical protein